MKNFSTKNVFNYEKFFELNNNKTHFDDVVHLNKGGNELVAEMYYKKITEII